MFEQVVEQLKAFPEYVYALKGALSILLAGLPVYLGLWYFLYRRKLTISLGVTFNFIGAFVLFAGLAFLLASPLGSHLPDIVIKAYLFLTCVVAAMGVVSLIDIFFLRYYLVQLKRVYISPPLRAVIKIVIFIVAILPILRYVLDFNPLALVAIPTIATAGLALALQDTLKTFIAGVALGHIIRLDEWISFENREGRVVDINWARTTIETIHGERVYIPNSVLQTGIFQNYSASKMGNRQVFKVGVSYETAPEQAKEVLARSLGSAKGVIKKPSPEVLIEEYGESAIVYGLHYWIEDYAKRLDIRDEVASQVWSALKRESISIPYPTRTVHMTNSGDAPKRERVRNGRDKS